jgi:hypothetical protein
MKLSRLLAPFLFLFAPLCLHAQLGLYGAFTAQNLGGPNSNGYDLYGGTFGAYLASGRLAVLSVGVDLRGSFARSNNGTSFDTGSIGPRIGLNTHILPIHPYIEGTIGLGHIDFTGSTGSETKLEYQVLGGLDFTILPRIDWRVAEYSYGGLSTINNYNYRPKSLSTGLVLRLPRIFPLP